jgi:hypothetical protein
VATAPCEALMRYAGLRGLPDSGGHVSGFWTHRDTDEMDEDEIVVHGTGDGLRAGVMGVGRRTGGFDMWH